MPSLPRVDRLKTIYSAPKALNYGWRFTDHVKQPSFNGVTRYIPQVHRITFRFCKQSEGSVGVRNFVEERLISMAERHPSCVVNFDEPIRNSNPTIRAEYANGRIVQMEATGLSMEEIEKDVRLILSRSGLPIVKLEGRQSSTAPSIQGQWTPFTWQPARMANAQLLDPEFAAHKTVKQSASDFILEHHQHINK